MIHIILYCIIQYSMNIPANKPVIQIGVKWGKSTKYCELIFMSRHSILYSDYIEVGDDEFAWIIVS